MFKPLTTAQVKEDAPSVIKIGLTGPIGSGKSTVASIWASSGARVVEGDTMGRWALDSDKALRAVLAKRFGAWIIDRRGIIIRQNLAQAAFSSPEGRADLTRLTFPSLYRLAKSEMARLEKAGVAVVIFDAALIFEWGVEKDFDTIVVVSAPETVLLDRIEQRMGVTRSEARNRLRAQLSPLEKACRADYLIINDGTLEELEEKARMVWEKIQLLER